MPGLKAIYCPKVWIDTATLLNGFRVAESGAKETSERVFQPLCGPFWSM